MRKLLLAFSLLLAGVRLNAFELYKGIEILVPFADVGAVFLYDLVGKESLVGAETSIVRFTKAKNLTITVGAVTDVSIDSKNGELREKDRDFFTSGTPFIGAHIPIKSKIKPLDLGAFLSRNITEGKNMAGIKASVKFW